MIENLNVKFMKKNVNKLMLLNKRNVFIFKVGRFIQNINYKDTAAIEALYNDFMVSNMVSEIYLKRLKEKIKSFNGYSNKKLINELTLLKECSTMQMNLYFQGFNEVMEKNNYKPKMKTKIKRFLPIASK